MNRRELLRGLAAGSLVTAIPGCYGHEEQSKAVINEQAERKTSTLKIVLNGPFGIVFEKSKPGQVTAFVPFDPQRLHQFYFNEMASAKDAGKDSKRSYKFRLDPRGIRKNTSRMPYVDRCFNDFNRTTDVWKRMPYFLTIELPVPDVITFAGAAEAVTFVQNHRHGVMPLNHIFEYKIYDADDIRMTDQSGAAVKPIPSARLREEYKGHCGTSKTPAHNESCNEMMGYLSGEEDANGIAYFFGVGLSPAEGDTSKPPYQNHALEFFNKVLLASFPGLQKSLELASIDGSVARPDLGSPRSNPQSATLAPAVWREDMSPRLLQVSAVIDCKVGGLLVDTSGTQG